MCFITHSVGKWMCTASEHQSHIPHSFLLLNLLLNHHLLLLQVSMLNRYSDAIRGDLSKILRLKVVALVTVEVHARDVLDKLAKMGCCDISAFDWLCQLRLYWEKVREPAPLLRHGGSVPGLM